MSRRGSELRAQDTRRMDMRRTTPRGEKLEIVFPSQRMLAHKPAESSGETWWICDRVEFARRLASREAARMRVSKFGGSSQAVFAEDSAWTGRREQLKDFAPKPQKVTL